MPISEWTERLRAVVPGGSSTTSKAPTLPPDEPAVIARGRGGRVWDERGREFIDFRNGLGPVTLGYCFPAVDEAIRRQLECGIVFGHPHRLECEVAERLCALVPAAERVRFLKTGGEALSAAIRLARAYTGRDHEVQIGYNGWLNALAPGGPTLPGRVGADAPRGVPAALSALHHAVRWNDRDAVTGTLDRLAGRVAAVVVAADYADLAAGKSFYPWLRDVTREAGALLVLDEIVTGFRIAAAGVQEHFAVTPDLSVFSKGIANGMPLSAYCGRADVMEVCASGEVSISSTFGGETLSLAAAAACIDTYQERDVVGHLWTIGRRLWDGLNAIFARAGLPLRMLGLAPCPQLVLTPGADPAWRPAFLRAAFRHGVSLYTVSYVTFSHSNADVDDALGRLERACAELADARPAPVG